MDGKLIGQRLALVFLLGLALFNDPILSLFDRGGLIGGFPLIYVYLFVVWAALIALVAVTVGRSRQSGD